MNSDFSTRVDMALKEVVLLLGPQREMIESIHGKLPGNAYDEYSLGYIIGIGSEIMKSNSINYQNIFIDFILNVLYVAYGNGIELGLTEKELYEKIRLMAHSQPVDYLKGQEAAAKDYNYMLAMEFKLPLFGWSSYIEEASHVINDYESAIKAVVNYSKCTPEKARKIIDKNINKFKTHYKKEDIDDYLAETTAEVEVFKKIAELIKKKENTEDNEAYKVTSDEKTPSNNNIHLLENDEEFMASINLAVHCLEPQIMFIKGDDGLLPPKAYDAFSLGYIEGLCGLACLNHGLDEYDDIEGLDVISIHFQFIIKSIFGDVQGLTLIRKISEPGVFGGSDFREGRAVGFDDLEKAQGINFLVPPMGWAEYTGAVPCLE